MQGERDARAHAWTSEGSTKGVRWRTFAAVGVAMLVAATALPSPATAAYTPGWQGAVTIENDAGGLFFPSVAVSDDGGALAVWYQYGSVYYNRYAPGSGWGAPGLVETNDTAFARYPMMAGARNGDAVAVWVYPGPSGDDFVYANRYNPATGWGVAGDIHPGSTGYKSGPQVAVSEGGDALAVWEEQNSSGGSDVMAARFTAAGGWEAPRVLDETVAGVFAPRVVMDKDGNALAVWSEFNTSHFEIRGAHYTAGGAWGSVQTLSRNDSADEIMGGLSLSENGDALAVWTEQGSYPWNILGAAYTPQSGWQASVPLETGAVQVVADPRVATDDSGNGCAVWWGQESAEPRRAWQNCFEKGVGWGAEGALDVGEGDITSANPSTVTVAMDPSGVAVAAWAQSDGIAQSAWAARRTPSEGWGEPQLLETDSTGGAGVPAVTLGHKGMGMAIWGQDYSSRSRVMANAFVVPDSTPPALDVGSPASALTTNGSTVTVSGVTEVGARVTVAGAEAAVADDGSFRLEVALLPGPNSLRIQATDAAGNSRVQFVQVFFDDPIPALQGDLASAEASLAESRAAVALLETQLNATRADANATQQDVTAAEAALAAAQAALAAAQASVTALSEELAAAQTNATTQQARISALEAQAASSNASAASAEASARSSKDQAAGASSLALLGVLLGVGGIAVGALGLLRGGRGGPSRKEEPAKEPSTAPAEAGGAPPPQ